MRTPHTLLLPALVLLCVLGAPNSVVKAQCWGWNTSLYVDAYYDPGNWSMGVYGAGVDYDAWCCYHADALEIDVWTPSTTWNVSFSEETGHIVGALEEGLTRFGVRFWVFCWCSMSIVGFEEVNDEMFVPVRKGVPENLPGEPGTPYANFAFTFGGAGCPWPASPPNESCRPVSGTMTINQDESRVGSVNNDGGRLSYQKFTQHELGHFHGMAHAGSAGVRTTVMRTPHGDHGNFLPAHVTPCDADKAYERGQ